MKLNTRLLRQLPKFYSKMEKALTISAFVLIFITAIGVGIRTVFAEAPLEVQDVMSAGNDAYESGVPSWETHTSGMSICPQGQQCEYISGAQGNTLAGALILTFGATTDTQGQTRLGPPKEGEMYAYVSPGAVQTTTSYMARMMGTPPASSVEYIAYLRDSFSNPFGAQPAYAQGIGFSSLSPVLGLWRLFRNLAYFLFVIIFLVTGFLIMFRSKIGGQAAVTVQQALPKMIVSLLLVTFSYAIAGLLIDVMYLLIYLIIGIFQIQGHADLDFAELVRKAFEYNIFSNGLDLIANGRSGGMVGDIAGALGNLTVDALGLEQGWLGAYVVQGAANIVFTLILAVAILVALFRVFFNLLISYISVFLLVIFSPIQLLLGALPGQNTFGPWVKSIFEKLLVFPVIIAMIFIAYYFTKVSFTTTNTGFSAPQLSSNQGSVGSTVYGSLIALGVILAMPEVVKITQGLMKGKIDISGKQLAENLFAGNQYAAPVVGLAAGAGYGAVAGGVAAYRARGLDLRQIARGSLMGFQDPSSNKVYGGLRRTGPQGFSYGQNVAGFIDRAREGKLFNPDTINRQLDAIRKSTEAARGGDTSGGKSSSGGASGSSGAGSKGGGARGV